MSGTELIIVTESTSNESQISSIVNCSESKSYKIRKLSEIGCKRSEISKLLNIRYQHVRNVLITPLKKQS